MTMTEEMHEKLKAEHPALKLEMKDGSGAKLSDSQLEQVAGGFQERRSTKGAWGQQVKCPSCGEYRWEWIDDNENDYMNWTKYQCRSCGHTFMVDKDGLAWDTGTVIDTFNKYDRPV